MRHLRATRHARHIGRRALLKSLSAGASGWAFAPLLNKLAAQEAGAYKTPKRVVFVLFGNGFLLT